LYQSENEQLRQENMKLKGGTKTTPGVAATPATATGGGGTELKPEDFESYGEYITALANKVWEDRSAAEKNKAAGDRYELYRAEKHTEFSNHAAPLAAEYEGFWDAISDPNLPCTEVMADAVMELGPIAPLTMLYLASHQDEAAKISRMNPRAATIAIGRIAAQLDIDIKADGKVAGQQGEAPLSGPTGAEATGGAVPATLPKPTPVPVPRGSTPAAAMTAAPSDKDDVTTWTRKETERLRRIHPHGRFYGA
jgi:hypothetical protein